MEISRLDSMIRRILIAEWIPSKNKGELAILKGMLKTFELLGSTEVSIFSFEPREDSSRYPEELRLIDIERELFLGSPLLFGNRLQKLKASMFSFIQHFLFSILFILFGKSALKIMRNSIWKRYMEADVILICHDQISCVGGFILEFSPLYLLFLAKVLKKPIVIYANGFSRITRSPIKFLARMVLKKTNLVTLRDPVSLSHVKEITTELSNIFLTADPVILLEPSSAEGVAGILSRENINASSKMLIGVTLTQEILMKIDSAETDSLSKLDRAIGEFANLFDNVIEKFDAMIIFIPHCIEPYQNRDDRKIHQKIFQNMRNYSKVRNITNEYSPEEFKGIFKVLNFFIGARIHSVIGALSVGVPSIAITNSQDKRALGLIGRILKQEEWLYHIEKFTSESLQQKIRRLISSSDEIRRNLPEITKSAKRKAFLNGEYLKKILQMETVT